MAPIRLPPTGRDRAWAGNLGPDRGPPGYEWVRDTGEWGEEKSAQRRGQESSLAGVPEQPGRGAIHQPEDPAAGGVDDLGWEAIGLVVSLQDLLQRLRLLCAAHEEDHTGRTVQHRWGQGDPAG